MALVLLLVAHLLGDWLVQTDWQAANKTSSWRAMAGHVLGYHLLMLLLLIPVWQLGPVLITLAVSAATHAFIDRRWPVRRLMALTGSPNFASVEWGVLATDQALHLSILLLLSLLWS